MKSITVVIPVYNETGAIEENLPEILRKLRELDHVALNFILVDDGSTDGTPVWLKQFCEHASGVELLCLSRNFGKEAAILAGLSHAKGDAVVVMDSDLQHPPQLVARMVAIWEQGIDVVDACKSSRGEESRRSAFFASGFYRLFNLMAGMNIKDQSDFKLLDRKVVDAYCALPERKRFFRGLVSWMGYSSAHVPFDVPERQRGATAWSKLRLVRYSLDALTGFSTGPLHLITILGVICLGFSLVIGGIALHDKFTGSAVSGFTTVILLILLIGSFIMVGLGLIGVYIDQIFSEVKRRPPYLIDERKSHLKTGN